MLDPCGVPDQASWRIPEELALLFAEDVAALWLREAELKARENTTVLCTLDMRFANRSDALLLLIGWKRCAPEPHRVLKLILNSRVRHGGN